MSSYKDGHKMTHQERLGTKQPENAINPLMRSSSSKDANSGGFLFGTLRRSFREVKQSLGNSGIFRIPATPRLVRSKRVSGGSKASLDWRWEKAEKPPSLMKENPRSPSEDPRLPHIWDRAFYDIGPAESSMAFNNQQSSRSSTKRCEGVTDSEQLVVSPPPEPDLYTELLDLSGDLVDGPPSPEEAQQDIYARVQTLLRPAPVVAPSPRETRRRFLFPNQSTRIKSPNGLYEYYIALQREKGSSDAQRSVCGGIRNSQQSLMSLMSDGSNFQSPLSPRNQRKSYMHSVSSGSSPGSYGDLYSPPKSSCGGSRRSYPLNCLFPPPRTSQGSHKSSGVSACSPGASLLTTPPGLTIRPLFELDTTSPEVEQPFVGREWLFRDIFESLLRSKGASEWQSGSVIIHGCAGSGKTTVARQLILNSPFFLPGNVETRASLDSGVIADSRMSLNQTSPKNFEWMRNVAQKVVAYHLCHVESCASCAVPEFVCHLAAQLATSPYLRPYADYLVSNTDTVQSLLTVTNCLRMDPNEVFKTAICEPLKTLKPPESGHLLILVDAVDEADFHKPESTDSIASFLVKNCRCLPSWIRLIFTVRTENLDILDNVGSRRITLDDAVLDERVWRDARFYVDCRLGWSANLRLHISNISGLLENEDPLNHFAHHLVTIARGNFLYLRLTLDLLERGQLRLKSSNYSVLPVSLPEVFLLLFNLKFPSSRAFELVAPIFSVLLASLQPLTAKNIFEIINAGRTDDYMIWEEFCDRLLQLEEFLIQKQDDTYVPFHPGFRDWLMRRQDGYSPKFLADIRQGHVLLALWLSRRGNLEPDSLLELGHHLLKAHPYKHLKAPTDKTTKQGATGRDCQLMWIQQSSRHLLRALCSDRNIACPNTKVSRLLLLAGADPDACLEGGESLLCRAAAAGQTDLCSLLLEFNAKLDCVDDQGRTPLMLAAAAGHLDVVQILHQHGAKLSQVDSRQRCPLVHAAECGHVTVVSFLLQCDWCEQSTNQSTSSNTSSTEVIPQLRQKALQQAFVRACANGKTKVAQFLFEMCEVSLEAPDPFTSETARCAACANGQADSVRYLLSCGVQLKSSIEQIGPPPLICAVVGGSWEIVSMLLARGLDVDGDKDETGRTSLMAAAQHGHIGVMELLLSRDASVDVCDINGCTSLCWSCHGNHHACAALLLDRGASLNVTDNQGKTPLHFAAEKGTKHLIQVLLERGAKLESVDCNGFRPLDLSVRARNSNALQCFLRRGAKLGATTWDLAKNCPEIALTLLQKLVEDGNLLYRRSRIKDAAHRFNYALKKMPSNYTSGESPLAESQLTRARDIHYGLILGLGRCKRRQGDFKSAIECCSQAIELCDKGAFEAYFLRAKCHFDAQDMVQARKDAEHSVKLCPQSRDARNLLQSLTVPTNEANEDMTLKDNNLQVTTDNYDGRGLNKSASPAECSSDSGNQADFEDPNLISPGRRSIETEL